MTPKNLRILWSCWLVVVGLLFNHTAIAADKPRLVLLPVSLEGDQNLSMVNQYGSALQHRLSQDYQVIYGRDVKAELDRIYRELESRIDCDAGLCNREIALAFNSRRVADASVTRTSSGYALLVKVRDAKSGQVLDTISDTCRNCDELDVIDKLKNLGQSQTSLVDDQDQGVTPVQSKRAILIIDSQPSGANISINGKSANVTPYQGLDHKPGQQLTVTLEKQHYLRKELTVRLNQPITELLGIQLQKGQGELLVITEPYQKGVSVSLNGKPVGTAPYQASVAAGEYQITIKTADGRVGEVDKTVQHGKETQVTFNVKTKSTAKTDQKARSYTVGGVDFKLVNIPAGSFLMGSNKYSDEKPVHRVSISSFYMMEHEVTFALWDACVSDGKCERPNDRGWGRGSRPVIYVSWDDITRKFIPWLNRKTGKTFRLPSESEWEYAARAGSTTKYSWGDSIDCSKARYGYYSDECGKQKSTDPVKSFSPNAFGLYDMHGNVWEWVQDCWINHYNNGPYNNRARESGDCAGRVLRGGSWYSTPTGLRSAYRYGDDTSNRYNFIGFRLVQAP